ncbi:MAG TPA: c-type cytochrome, partial [Acidisarcina sp.]
DFPAPPALVTIRRNGNRVDALAQTTKQGVLYLFDRTTGKPLFPIEEHCYPASTVPGEVTSPTQPMPVFPAPYGRQRLTEDMLTTRTPAAHEWAVKEFRTFRSDGQFVPMVVNGQTVVFPGFDGGAEWGGPAVDPSTGVLYVNANEMAWTGGLEEDKPSGNPGADAYQSQCAVCHGSDRAGSPPAFPSLLDIETRLSDPQIIDVIQHGKGRMPALPSLDSGQLTSLLRFLESPPVAGAPIDAKELPSAPAVKLPEAANPNGSALYQERCALCHGEQMEGTPPSFPTLVGVGQRLSIAQAVAIIHEGKGKMPAQPDIQGADLDALLRAIGIDLTSKPNYVMAGGGTVNYRFTGYRKFLDPDGYPAISPPWGTLSAINLNTGAYLWKIPLGEYPTLAAQGMTNTGSENYGGPIVTAGGVVFIGATVYDRKFRAFDSTTGKLLWETVLPFAGMATPSTYAIDGKQYVVIASSGGRDPKSPVGGMYIAFALP